MGLTGERASSSVTQRGLSVPTRSRSFRQSFFFFNSRFGVPPLLDLLLNGLRLHSALQAPGLVLVHDFRDDVKVFIGEQPLEVLRLSSASGIDDALHFNVIEVRVLERTPSTGRDSELCLGRPSSREAPVSVASSSDRKRGGRWPRQATWATELGFSRSSGRGSKLGHVASGKQAELAGSQ